MANAHVRINSQALIGYDTLDEQEREALAAVLVPLVKRSEKQWPKFGAIKLDSAEPLYLLHVDKSLRAFVKPLADGQPEVVDFVRQELLDRYFKEMRLSARVGECNEEKHKIINTKGKIMSSKIINPEIANCRSDTTKLNGIHDFVLLYS